MCASCRIGVGIFMGQGGGTESGDEKFDQSGWGLIVLDVTGGVLHTH